MTLDIDSSLVPVTMKILWTGLQNKWERERACRQRCFYLCDQEVISYRKIYRWTNIQSLRASENYHSVICRTGTQGSISGTGASRLRKGTKGYRPDLRNQLFLCNVCFLGDYYCVHHESWIFRRIKMKIFIVSGVRDYKRCNDAYFDYIALLNLYFIGVKIWIMIPI